MKLLVLPLCVLLQLGLALRDKASAEKLKQKGGTAAAAAQGGLDVPVREEGGLHHRHDAAEVVHHQDSNLVTIPRTEVQVPHVLLPLAFAFVGGGIVLIYGQRGARVVVPVLIYVTALSMMKLSVKWVFLTHAFRFPKLLSGLHFCTGAICTALVLLCRGGSFPRPSMRDFWLIIFPISLAVVLSIGSQNMALVSVSAGFTEIIGATNCLVTIAMVLLMGMPFDKVLILPALVVTFGCTLSTAGEVNFSLVGALLSLLSNVFRSVKVTLQQKLLTGETKDNLDPCALLFWISIPSMLVMLLASLLTEGRAPYLNLAGRTGAELSSLVVAVLVSCVNAGILNLAQLFVTKDLGAVGSQLVAQAKMVLTVLGGMIFFGEAMSQLEVLGFALALAGVFAFSRMEHACKEARRKELTAEVAKTT